MRSLEILENNKTLKSIIKKVKNRSFPSQLSQLADWYMMDTEDGDIYFIDQVINLEPLLKQEICSGHISEREMDYFFEIYGSVTNDKDL